MGVQPGTGLHHSNFKRFPHRLSEAGQLQGASQHRPASCVLGHDGPEALDGPQANLVSMDSRLQAVRYYLTHNIWMYL